MLVSRDNWRAELIPLLLFGMTVAIAHNQELALLLSSAVALVIVVSIGQGLSDFVILAASVATAILLVGPYSQPSQTDLRRLGRRRRGPNHDAGRGHGR